VTPRTEFKALVASELAARGYTWVFPGRDKLVWRGSLDCFTELTIHKYGGNGAILRVAGNQGRCLQSYSILKRLGYHRRRPCYPRQCEWGWLSRDPYADDSDEPMVCLRCGSRHRGRAWQATLATSKFELTMLASELAMLARFSVGLADGDARERLVGLPGLELIKTETDTLGAVPPWRLYLWTRAADALWEKCLAEREFHRYRPGPVLNLEPPHTPRAPYARTCPPQGEGQKQNGGG